MNLKDTLSTKRLLFLLIFTVLVFAGNRVNFSALVGADNQFFTLFQFFGPIAGGFLGSAPGAITVLLAELLDAVAAGKAFTLLNILRFAPMAFGALFFVMITFRKKNDPASTFLAAAVPAACIALFVLHPVGREVWYFSLYWLIPVAAALLPRKTPGALLLRSYGATFTAHAVCGALWIWTVPMSPEQWIALIPVVAFERFLFGLGIGGSYILVNSFLDFAAEKMRVPLPEHIVR